MSKNKKYKIIKYKYFIKYNDYHYVLKDLYGRTLKRSLMFKSIYDFILENEIKFEDVHIGIKSLKDFSYYATFEERYRI